MKLLILARGSEREDSRNIGVQSNYSMGKLFDWFIT